MAASCLPGSILSAGAGSTMHRSPSLYRERSGSACGRSSEVSTDITSCHAGAPTGKAVHWASRYHLPTPPVSERASSRARSSNPVSHEDGAPPTSRPAKKATAYGGPTWKLSREESAPEVGVGGGSARTPSEASLRNRSTSRRNFAGVKTTYLAGEQDMLVGGTRPCLKSDLPVSDELRRINTRNAHYVEQRTPRQHTKADAPPSAELRYMNDRALLVGPADWAGPARPVHLERNISDGVSECLNTDEGSEAAFAADAKAGPLALRSGVQDGASSAKQTEVSRATVGLSPRRAPRAARSEDDDASSAWFTEGSRTPVGTGSRRTPRQARPEAPSDCSRSSLSSSVQSSLSGSGSWASSPALSRSSGCEVPNADASSEAHGGGCMSEASASKERQRPPSRRRCNAGSDCSSRSSRSSWSTTTGSSSSSSSSSSISGSSYGTSGSYSSSGCTSTTSSGSGGGGGVSMARASSFGGNGICTVPGPTVVSPPQTKSTLATPVSARSSFSYSGYSYGRKAR
eukprot:TRINITY_DN4636_c1_g1_i4.p1 TRINITY_DN4636_c1_g1~~TRINITY_DN4636_c1_g1_i4.p1  ORF type:complete len:550 (+),score=95.92 TRINITY_DN4636_c1_g1_i4:105-1652(+)